MSAKTYLGDGCYVDRDGAMLILTTSDGMRDTNRIAMEPEVYAALLAYVAREIEKERAVRHGRGAPK